MKKIPVRRFDEAQRERGSLERFNIRRVQDIISGDDLKHDLHRHDFFFILALQKAEGIHEIDFHTYELRDRIVFVMKPGQVHQLILKAGSSGYLIEFNTEFYHTDRANQRIRKAVNKNFCQLEEGRFKKLDTILSHIYDEYSEKTEGYQDIIKANLDIFFIELTRQSPNANTPTNPSHFYTQERLEEFLELLEMHITTNKQVSFYTNLMNLSAYQLNEITKSTVGKTASEQINEHIILEAKRHLIATSNQVKDIAFNLGYEDISYFIRFFKKHTGLSPDAFRKNLR